MQINNVVLVSSMVIILWGTLAPIGYEVINGNLYSIGKPFFDFFFVPLMLFLAVAIGFVPLLRWKKTNFDHLLSSLKALLPTTLVLTFLIAYLIDFKSTAVVLCCGLGCWILVNHFGDALSRFRDKGFFSRSYFGMSFAHIGFAITIVGVACTTVFSVEEDVRMEPGDTQIIGPLKVSFVGVSDVPGPNYIAKRGIFDIERSGEFMHRLLPEKRTYSGGKVMTEAGIEAGFWADTYISMGEPLTEDAWAVRLHYKPLVRWIWFGGILMALGGILSAIRLDSSSAVRRKASSNSAVVASEGSRN